MLSYVVSNLGFLFSLISLFTSDPSTWQKERCSILPKARLSLRLPELEKLHEGSDADTSVPI